nr:methyltransferase domain-containing protein [Parafrankia soli]
MCSPACAVGDPGDAVGSEARSPGRTDRYFAEVADTWVDRYTRNPSFQERLRAVAGAIEPVLARSASAWVLDFGGGPGMFSTLCAGRAAFVLNLEPSVDMLQAGVRCADVMASVVRQATGADPGESHGVAGSLDVLGPKARERFDLVLAIAVLEYLEDPSGAVRRLGGLLRPGGAMVLTVPRSRSWARRGERALAPLVVRAGALVGWRRARERAYTRLRPHGDDVPWAAGLTVVDGGDDLQVESRRALALAGTLPRSLIRPNEIIIVRKAVPPHP